MNHLTDEQLEDIVQGGPPEPPHLAQCQHCQARLAEMAAVRGRLRSAFEDIRADDSLKDSLRAALDRAGAPSTSTQPTRKTPHLLVHRVLWPALAAAAVLVITIPVVIYFAWPQPAMAAGEEFYRIYEHNLSPHADLYAGESPEDLAGYLKEQLGFRPALPQPEAGMKLRGCCVVHFREKPAGSYVVESDHGVISIVVLTDRASAVGFREQVRRKGRTYELGSFAKGRMALVELDGFTYCAIGEVSYDFLIDLLDRLAPSAD